jgi:hypothetical protein
MPSSKALYRLVVAAATAALFGCASSDVTTPRSASDQASLSGPTTQSVSDFGILTTTTTDDESISAATDGTNWLVGLKTGDPSKVQAKIVKPNGTTGPLIGTGRLGDMPQVAFNGQLYLMAWEDHTVHLPPCTPQPFCIQPPDPVAVRGVFLTPAGTLSGTVFKISASNNVLALGGVVWNGTKFFVDYSVLNLSVGAVQVRGRFVSSGPTLGTDLVIASNNNFTGGINNLATDGTNILATYIGGGNTFYAVRARLIHGDGSMATATPVDVSAAPSNRPVGVAFGSGGYLVVWNDVTSGDETDIFGRFVSTAGVAIGTKFTIDANPGAQVATGVSTVGSDFFVTWLELEADPANSVAKGQFFTSPGTAHGTVKTLFTTDPGTGKIAAIAAPILKGSSFFFLVNRALTGVDPEDWTALNTWDLRGSIKTVTP